MSDIYFFLNSFRGLNFALAITGLWTVWALAKAQRPAKVLAVSGLVALLCVGVDYAFRPYMFRAAGEAGCVLFVHAPWVLMAACWRLRHAWRWALLTGGAGLVLLAVSLDALVYEPHALRTVRHTTAAPVSLRIAVMSDFQASHIGTYERDVLAQLGHLEADAVLLAGDYIQVPAGERGPVVADFRAAWRAAGIHPRLGIFAVRGDAEGDDWREEIFDGLDVVTADESREVRLGPFTLRMLSLVDSTHASARSGTPEDPWALTLGHRPDFALGPSAPGLLIAGHTHGGQVQIPFWGPPVILSGVPRAWGAGGLHRVDAQRQLMLTRGAGLEHTQDSPPLRFSCRPEIVELTLQASSLGTGP